MKKFLCYLSMAFALTACATSNEKPALEKIEESETLQLPSEFATAFTESSVNACTTNGNDINDCTCYSNEILKTFTVEDFATVYSLTTNSGDMNNIISHPEIGPKIIDASIKCFYKE